MQGQSIRKRAKRAIIASQRTLRLLSLSQGRLRHIARLARIPFGFAQGKLSLRKGRLFRMTIEVHHYRSSSFTRPVFAGAKLSLCLNDVLTPCSGF